ncbi:MAG TPA: hypothetical protein VMH28_05090 [Candidatus Acidoferrales bacterium]|nr:hypothetical protein [Candidatus Acidoferrales bacterium]
MRLRVLTIAAMAVQLVHGAIAAPYLAAVDGTGYFSGATISEPALLAVVGVALLGISRLLRK